MGRGTKKKKVTGPGVSDAPGPGGEGGIIPAPAPSSSNDGCEAAEEVRSEASMEVEPQISYIERPAVMLPGIDWGEDLAPWWDGPGARTLTAELFHRAIEVLDTVRSDVDDLVKIVGPFMAERPRAMSQVRGIVGDVQTWAQELAWMVAKLTRRECVRLGEDVGRSADVAPDSGKEFRDQGTKMEGGLGAPVVEAPLPGELVVRLEDMSSRLAVNSDRLGLVERRLREVESGRARAARRARGVSRRGTNVTTTTDVTMTGTESETSGDGGDRGGTAGG